MERYIGPSDIDSLENDQVWVGRQQGHSLTHTYRTSEIKTSPQGEKFVTFQKANGHISIFDLTESTYHRAHKFNPEEDKGNTIVRNRSVINWLEMSKVEGRIYDHRYGELDNFLSNTQIIKATAKPLFKSIVDGLSKRWNQLIDKLDMRLNRDILATQSPMAQRYNTP